LAIETQGDNTDACNAVSSLAPLPLVNRKSEIVNAPVALTTIAPAECLAVDPVQPVLDVPSYLEDREKSKVAIAHFADEPALFQTLPDKIKTELRGLLGVKPGKGAYSAVERRVKDGLSVTKACAEAYAAFSNVVCTRLAQFRANYDLYARTGDWVALVNRAKAGIEWQVKNVGLPEPFLKYVEQRRASFRRGDGMQQAIISIQTQWQTGLTPKGILEAIPGYDDGWTNRNPHLLPKGWHHTNIRRQLAKRGNLTAPVTNLIQISTAAAKELLPRHLTSRNGLRFLERVTFDDVRTDWLIFDTESGQPCELWILVARDHATAMVLGFVMHPCVVRPDASVSRLGLKQMKQLVAWILERYPLPPYVSHWTIERGTATISEGDGAMLAELLPGQIELHYTSMIGGTSPTGYKEKKTGNSTGKASHESHNRLLHTQSCFIEGQTGNRWDIRPADLQARCDEAVEIWEMPLPEHLLNKKRYPLLLPHQARQYLIQFCLAQNFRTQHALEGFEQLLEWYDPANPAAGWRPQNTFVPGIPGVLFRKRMESPVERAIRLMHPYTGQWKKCPPDVIITFLSHRARQVTLKASGEIQFTVDGTKCVFAPPFPPSTLNPQPSTSLLGYHSPDDPSFLHVTDGQGRVLGTWFRRARLGYQDQELLEQAMRYTAAALAQVNEKAATLTAPERAGLQDMRNHNQELAERADALAIGDGLSAIDRGPDYNDVASSCVPAVPAVPSNLPSTVARAMAAIPRERQRHADTQSADEALAASLDAI